MSVDAARGTRGERGSERSRRSRSPAADGGNIVSQLPRPAARVRYGSTITVYYA